MFACGIQVEEEGTLARTAESRSGGWAIVVAPGEDGWKVRCLRHGARLAEGGGACESLTAALADVHALAQLLEDDDLTAELFLNA